MSDTGIRARVYSFSCTVLTAFGTVQVTTQPQPGSAAIITTTPAPSTSIPPTALLVRRQETTNGQWDPQRGQNLQNLISGVDAVAQIIRSTILLLQGEWWAARNRGLPLFQEILGRSNTTQGVGLILQQQILTVPFVQGIQNLVVVFSGNGVPVVSAIPPGHLQWQQDTYTWDDPVNQVTWDQI